MGSWPGSDAIWAAPSHSPVLLLFVAQETFAGAYTIHEIWVSNDPIGNDRKKAKLVHTFKGETTNLQALKFDFPKDMSARYIEVRTTQSPTWIAWWEIEIRVREEKPCAPRRREPSFRSGP